MVIYDEFKDFMFLWFWLVFVRPKPPKWMC